MMPSTPWLMSLLMVVCFSMATWLEPRYTQWKGDSGKSDDILTIALGDSRRMFANHFFVKADVYFHSGYYPSIFDEKKLDEKSHMMEQHDEHDEHNHANGHDEHDDHDEDDFLGPPKDFIDKFSRNFFNAHHTHLSPGNEREILPWLRISADLDPHRVETYTVAAYWLRSRLNKPKEAEQFLREGLQANPDSYEILFELGQTYYDSYQDIARARNVFELALKKWSEQEPQKKEPNKLALEQILARLVALEEKEKNWAKCIQWMELLKKVSPIPDQIEKEIQDIKQKNNLK